MDDMERSVTRVSTTGFKTITCRLKFDQSLFLVNIASIRVLCNAVLSSYFFSHCVGFYPSKRQQQPK